MHIHVFTYHCGTMYQKEKCETALLCTVRNTEIAQELHVYIDMCIQMNINIGALLT